MNKKLDLFNLLNQISQDNPDFINTLTEDELKSFSPYVFLLWLKGANNNKEGRYCLMNEVLNPYVFSLSDHKKLLYKLMCVSNGFGINTRFYFSKKKRKTTSGILKLLMGRFECTLAQAEQYRPLVDLEELVEYAHYLGYEDKEIKELEKEYNQ